MATFLIVSFVRAIRYPFIFYKQKTPGFKPGVSTFFNVFYALGKQYTPTALEGKKEKRAERSVLCDFRMFFCLNSNKKVNLNKREVAATPLLFAIIVSLTVA